MKIGHIDSSHLDAKQLNGVTFVSFRGQERGTIEIRPSASGVGVSLSTSSRLRL